MSGVRTGKDAGPKIMKRRNVLKALAGGAMLARAADVKRVLVMFKCHLDVGFTDTQAGVMKKYFDVYYPEAMKRAAAMREAHKLCDDHEDSGTAGLLETFIDETERRTWFLFEASRQEGSNAE